MIKVYAAARDREQRYSPAEVVDVEVVPRVGMPDYERIYTSHIERQNLTMRMQIRRLTRLSNAFSKKWRTCGLPSPCTLPITISAAFIPASESPQLWKPDLTDHIWSIGELLA